MNGPETSSRRPHRDRRVLFGIAIDNLDLAGVLDALEGLIAARRPSLVVTPNAQHIELLGRDGEFRSVYREASLVVPDGVPIVWASALLGRRLKARVAGSDILPAFCAPAARKGYRLFLLGAGPGIAARAADRLTERNPGLVICGTYSPPLGFERDAAERDRIVGLVRRAGPDALFVGLGTPKSEKWAWKHLDQLSVPAVVCVGAGLDFAAGARSRAPRWMQSAGLEWSYRLVQEPGRLWKRYLVGNAKFLVELARELIERRAPSEKTSVGSGRPDARTPVPNESRLLEPWRYGLKRGLSLASALVLCLLLTPVFLLIAAAILLDSRGPILYFQDRLGRGEKPFRIYKFRSMRMNAEAELDSLLERDPSARVEWTAFHKIRGADPRVTRVGSFLRKWSLDELPQLFNVLRGDMSLIGPRPYLPGERDRIRGRGRLIFKVHPGITGLWQVRGRNLRTFADRIRLDEFYIRNWSFGLDTVILLRTVKAILRREGAF